MRYITKGWQNLKGKAVEGLDADFVRHLRGFERPVQIAYARIMGACKGDPAGVELRHKDMECWAFVLPNVSSPEPWRCQYFDSFAFSRHACFGSMEKAIDAAIREGYRILDPGALERASKGEAWQKGLAWTEEVRRLSFQQAA